MATRYKIVLSPSAIEDIEQIVVFHSQVVGKTAARKIYGVIKENLYLLSKFPFAGSLHPDIVLAKQEFRKLVISRTYVAIYRVIGDKVIVYRIVNGRTDYQRLLY